MYIENEGFVIKCPYCFHEFHQENTVFRAHTAYDRSELEMSDYNDGGGLLAGRNNKKTDKDPRELFLRFDIEGGRKQDEKLISFWKDRGGSSGYVTVDSTWDHPHIDPRSDDFFEMICTEPRESDIPGSDGFVRDNDGFIMRVLDRYESSPKPMERLCPSCHNPMPLADYGKYPVIFISVVGDTGAGKTVFLNQLLTEFADKIDSRKFTLGTSNLNAIGEAVGHTLPLPASTDDKVMRRPLAVTLLKNNGSIKDHLTLVFYDIAGENCVNANGNPDVARAQSTIGKFVAFCDSLIFLLDPEQIPMFSNKLTRPSIIANVTSVVSTIRANMNPDAPNWQDIPVAVCLAKSDKLNGSPHIPADSPIFSHSNRDVPGFDREEHKAIHDFLRSFLQSNAYNIVAPLNTFRRSAFFAVSAITCGVESRFEKYQNKYILDEENEQKFKLLHSWAKGWDERSIENREFYRDCPILTKDGDPIVLPMTESITQSNASGIVTEIRADSVEAKSIYLTLWDVAYGVNLVGYPISNPAPRRVGDPMKWILWKMRKIGPYFSPSAPPRRGMLQSRRSYDAMIEAFYMEEERRLKEFYGDPLDDELS